MPSKFTPIRDIADNACIGTREGKKGGVWTLRYYGPTKSGKGNYYYKSLGMLFEEGRASERAARKIADAIYDSMEANAEAGVFPTLKITPDYIRKGFVADIIMAQVSFISDNEVIIRHHMSTFIKDLV